jgi:hypothetical protein
LLIGVTLARSAHAEEIERREMRLVVGQQVSLPAEHVVKYSEGVQGVVAVRLPEDGREFIVVGLNAGTSTLLLIYEDGHKLQITFTVKPVDSKVPKRENIRLDFYFVEINDTGRGQVGVGWPAFIGGGNLNGTFDLTTMHFSQAMLQVTGAALPRLDILQSNGWAKVARQAAVITANGSQAKFTSGGEVNIAVQGSLAAEIRQISFGSIVKVLPRHDPDSGRLELTIDAEFSSLAGEGAVPGRSLSSLSTIVNVELGQAVVLAGINAQSEARTKQGIPVLSQIPVIGGLFGSHGWRHENVQNLVFIVPSVVDLIGDSAQRQLQEALKVYSGYRGDFGAPLLNAPLIKRKP